MLRPKRRNKIQDGFRLAFSIFCRANPKIVTFPAGHGHLTTRRGPDVARGLDVVHHWPIGYDLPGGWEGSTNPFAGVDRSALNGPGKKSEAAPCNVISVLIAEVTFIHSFWG